MLTCVGIGHVGWSQSNVLHIEPTLSFNSVTMDDMKVILSATQDEIPIELQTIDNFPTYWGFGIEVVGNEEDRFSFGGILHYNSSGARISSADYSGSINYDILVNRVVLGPTFRFMEPIGDRYAMGVSGSILGSFSNLNFQYRLSILGQNESSLNRFSSFSGQIRLNWVNRYQVTPGFYFIGQLGYEFDAISTKLKFKTDRNAWLLKPGGGNARLDWSGVRLQLGIGITFDLEPSE
ncbi:MAG: hypothetical protein ABJG47_13970 [Ekhidna sp.]